MIDDAMERIIEDYRDRRRLTREQLDALVDFLSSLPDGYTNFLRERGYDEGALVRVRNLLSKRGVKRREELGPVQTDLRLAKNERETRAKMIDDLWRKIQDAGWNAMRFASRASELGFVDEKGEPDIAGFVVAALDFYSKYAPHIQEMEEEIEDLKAGAAVAYELLRDAYRRMSLIAVACYSVERAFPDMSLRLSPIKAALPKFKVGV